MSIKKLDYKNRVLDVFSYAFKGMNYTRSLFSSQSTVSTVPLVYKVSNNNRWFDLIPVHSYQISKDMKYKLESYECDANRPWDYIFISEEKDSVNVTLFFRYDTLVYLENPLFIAKRLYEGITFGNITPEGYYDETSFSPKLIKVHDAEWHFVYRLYHHFSRKFKNRDISYYKNVFKELQYYSFFSQNVYFETKAIDIVMSGDYDMEFQSILDENRVTDFISRALDILKKPV